MVDLVTPADVLVFVPGTSEERAAAMIRSITARAVAIAPCIAGDGLSDAQREAVRAVILDAVARWATTGHGAVTQQQAGPFSQTTDTRQERRGAFLKPEVDDLRAVCQDVQGTTGAAFSIFPGGGRALATRARPGLDDWALAERGWLA